MASDCLSTLIAIIVFVSLKGKKFFVFSYFLSICHVIVIGYAFFIKIYAFILVSKYIIYKDYLDWNKKPIVITVTYSSL